MTRASATATARKSADVPVGPGAAMSRVHDDKVEVCCDDGHLADIVFFLEVELLDCLGRTA